MDKTDLPDLDLQSLLDSHTNPFALVDEHYSIVAANKAFCDCYGTTDEDVVGCKCHKVSHQFETPCPENDEDCPLARVLETGESHEVQHVHFDQFNQPEQVRIKGHPITAADGTRYIGEEVIRLGRTIEPDCEEQQQIGRSAAFSECMADLASAADADTHILLVGERGTGKRMAARYVHNHSPRKGRAFVTLDCSAVNEALIESELFGHERGAFTGCVGRRRGLLDQANGGTLYLDAVNCLPLTLQGQLLNAIETGYFHRVGGRELLKSDARIIASTQLDLPAMIQEGTFSSDLYRCLAGIVHRIPSLRERKADIPALADALLVRLRDPTAYRCHIDDHARERLTSHDYPGNITELRNILQRAVACCSDGHIKAEHVHFDIQPEFSTPSTYTIVRSLKQIESEQIALLLEKHQGHRRRVAGELGISERTLYRKLEKYGLTTCGR